MSSEAKAWVWAAAIIALTVVSIAIATFIYSGYKVSHHPRVEIQRTVIVKVEAPK